MGKRIVCVSRQELAAKRLLTAAFGRDIGMRRGRDGRARWMLYANGRVCHTPISGLNKSVELTIIWRSGQMALSAYCHKCKADVSAALTDWIRAAAPPSMLRLPTGVSDDA